MIFSPADQRAAPPTGRLLLPYVSRPYGEMLVSPCSTSTSEGSQPSWSATICDQAVSWLCPWGDVPVTTWNVPVGRQRIVAVSQPPAAYRMAPRIRDGARPHISV